MARLKRFELLTHCLEGSCSIQLSYRRIKNGAGDGNRTHTTSLEGWDSAIELHPHHNSCKHVCFFNCSRFIRPYYYNKKIRICQLFFRIFLFFSDQLSMMCYKISSKNFTVMDKSFHIVTRWVPMKRTHRKLVVFIVVYLSLFCKIIKQKELMSSVKISIVFTVGSFHFPVVFGWIYFD